MLYLASYALIKTLIPSDWMPFQMVSFGRALSYLFIVLTMSHQCQKVFSLVGFLFLVIPRSFIGLNPQIEGGKDRQVYFMATNSRIRSAVA